MATPIQIEATVTPDGKLEIAVPELAPGQCVVGERGAPPLGTLDPAILDFCETERRILITNNRASMPKHVADHLAAGKHYWGVLNTRARKPPIGQLVEEILVMEGASEAEE